MQKIGITGGIGSGKSVVAHILSCMGIPVYIADHAAKQLINSSNQIKTSLIAHFGEALYTPKGIDKQLLASLIFSNKQHLLTVNQIVHPIVATDFQAWAKQQNTDFCAMESAILFESGFNSLVDHTLLVYTPQEIRIQRAMKRDETSRQSIEARIQNQQPDEQKIKLANAIIYNDNQHALIPQVEKLIALLSQSK